MGIRQPYPIAVRPSPVQVEVEGNVGFLDLRGIEQKVGVRGDADLVKKSVERADVKG